MKIDIQRFESNVRDNAQYIEEYEGTIKDYYLANIEQDERDVSCYTLDSQKYIDSLDLYNNGDQEERDKQTVYLEECICKIHDLVDKYDVSIEEFLKY